MRAAWSIETMESKANTLRVTVKRTEAFPQSVDAVDRALEENGLSYATRRALHALGSGYVRVELFDGERKHLGTASVRIAELREKDTAIIVLPVLRETPPATLQLTW